MKVLNPYDIRPFIHLMSPFHRWENHSPNPQASFWAMAAHKNSRQESDNWLGLKMAFSGALILPSTPRLAS